MHTLELSATDGPRSLAWVERPRPEPGPTEVRVAVGAAGINYADLLQSYGSYGDGSSMPLPFRPGLEFAGAVQAVGSEVARWKVGDRVMGLHMGCFAEEVVVPEGQLQAIPAGWSDGPCLSVPARAAAARPDRADPCSSRRRGAGRRGAGAAPRRDRRGGRIE